MLSCRSTDHACARHANYIDDELDLFAFIRTWEQGESSEELNHDATKGPHIDLLCVGEDAEHDIRSSIESTLNVSVHDLVFKTATAEIGDSDATLIFLFHQNVLRFQITVDDAEVFKIA